MKKLLILCIMLSMVGIAYGGPLQKGDRCRLIAGPDFDPGKEQVVDIDGSGEEVFGKAFGVKDTEDVIRSIQKCQRDIELLRYSYRCADPFLILISMKPNNFLPDDLIKYKGPFYYGHNSNAHGECYHRSWLEKIEK